jgi:hypothetical protein
MTQHHRILLLLIEAAGTQVTVGYLAARSGLPHSAVMQAALELCHKKMANNSSTLHVDDSGREFRTYVYRIKPRGREMCERIRNGAAK